MLASDKLCASNEKECVITPVCDALLIYETMFSYKKKLKGLRCGNYFTVIRREIAASALSCK